MFSAFKKFGKLGALASSVARAWSPLALWPDGIDTPGMWISPRTLTSEWQDYTGTTPVATPGTVADSANPVGLALDIRAGATVLTTGNHMLQSTSAARPLMSARVNLLTYTEDFSNAVWAATYAITKTTTKLIATAETANHGALVALGSKPFIKTFTVVASAAEYGFLHLVYGAISPADDVSFAATFNLTLGTVVKVGSWNSSASIVDLGGGVYECSCVGTQTTGGNVVISFSPTAATNKYLGDGVSGINVFKAQLEAGSTKTTYQLVVSDSSYTASVAPTYQQYDGVDDGMATAAFPAGTLIDGMDCLIAVRRDSAAQLVLASDGADEYFGLCVDGWAAPNTYAAGSPTVWVDNVQLAGGTAVTASTIHTALTVGDWHILEFRGLDLSAWASFCFSKYYAGFYLNGARGDIMLYPSTTPTEDKDAARQWLADYYGVTLP